MIKVMNGKNKKHDADAECECIAESFEKEAPQIKNITHPLRYYEFTQDEINALEECDRESFYRRCVPFSALFATLTYTAIKTGYLKKNKHFGVVPKVAIAAVLGYVCGRISYLGAYDERLRRLPADSRLGNLMRQYYAAANPSPGPKNRS